MLQAGRNNPINYWEKQQKTSLLFSLLKILIIFAYEKD
jgi:hypothetical protein